MSGPADAVRAEPTGRRDCATLLRASPRISRGGPPLRRPMRHERTGSDGARMSIHLDSAGNLHHDHAQSFALTCPHCQVLSHLTAVSLPQYSQLMAFKPSHVGIVYRCDSCNAPVFLKYPVKAYTGSRVELGTNFQ